MVQISRILVFMTWIAFVKCQMEPFIVGGAKVSIRRFPHSVYVFVTCDVKEEIRIWSCGGSIVNQKIILTAAHCVFGCTYSSTVTVGVGHSNKRKGLSSTVRTYYIHENYTGDATINDIALMKLKTRLKFGENVKRVALMKDPPYNETAQVAGWGRTDEDKKTVATILKYVDQYVWATKACKQVISSVPRGAICASSGNPTSFSSRGDSGSALVVRGYIQIGIVSYKMPDISRSLVVYTDTGFFYQWIRKNTKKLYCVIEKAEANE